MQLSEMHGTLRVKLLYTWEKRQKKLRDNALGGT